MLDDSERYPLALPVAVPPYRTLQFIARYGASVAILLTGVVLAAGFLLWGFGYGAAWIPISFVLAGFTYLMMNCVAELVHLIVDTMIPK